MSFWDKFRRTYPVYSYYSVRLRKYLAWQVVKNKRMGSDLYIGVVLFDWLGDRPVTREEFRKAKPATRILYCPPPVPRSFTHVFDEPRRRRFGGLPIFSISCDWWPGMIYDFENWKLFGSRWKEKNDGMLTLENETGTLDLRGRKSMIDIHDSRLDEIIIDCEVRHLSFFNATVKQVSSPDRGLSLHLSLSSAQVLPTGLEQLALLGIYRAEQVDLREIAALYPHLRELSIEGECGAISGFPALEKLPNLEYFHCSEMFGFDGTEMPGPEALPKLSYLWFETFPAIARKPIERRWKQVDGVCCWCKKTRTPEWLERNRDNPFRKWLYEIEDISGAVIRKAGDAHRDAMQQVSALSGLPEAERPAAFERMVRDFIAAFNAMNRQHSFIGEEDREEIWEVLEGIRRQAASGYGISLDSKALRTIFDAEKNF